MKQARWFSLLRVLLILGICLPGQLPVAAAVPLRADRVVGSGTALGCGGAFTASADTTLDQSHGSLAMGAYEYVRVSRGPNGDNYTLLAFELSSLPAGAAVHSAGGVGGWAGAVSRPAGHYNS
jgi:hypothetical protein